MFLNVKHINGKSRLQRNDNILLNILRQFPFILGNAQDKVHACSLADPLQLGNRICDIPTLQSGNLQKAVKIHLLQIMIL